MRKTTFAAVAAGALILAGFAGWAISSNRPLQAKASSAIEPPMDPFTIMLKGSIGGSIAEEALACSGRLLEMAHPAKPARINAPAATAANVVLRIWFHLRLQAHSSMYIFTSASHRQDRTSFAWHSIFICCRF